MESVEKKELKNGKTGRKRGWKTGRGCGDGDGTGTKETAGSWEGGLTCVRGDRMRG
jgi:hypothetical protein